MNLKDTSCKPCSTLLWDQKFYINLQQEVQPFNDLHLFRSLTQAYTGNNVFWSTPSPEPDLNDIFWQKVETSLNNNHICEAAQILAASILKWQSNPEKILFVSILRAGVPIADWLCRLLPGSVGAATSLFAGLGIDRAALNALQMDFPDRQIIFVDGWTGRGGVARELAALEVGPLAVLIDPWGWADFSGIQDDIFCPSACFTGVATLGFSRTFFVDNEHFFSAYKFSDKFTKPELIKTWQNCCPDNPTSPLKLKINNFFTKTDLRIHSNEVCRALINAAPKTLYFADDKSYVQDNFSLLLNLAEKRSVPLKYNATHLKKLKTRVACNLTTSLSPA
ncbi:MAG: tellurite-like stress resistance cysteine protease StiP [Thermodesulfobacteriota bacterium]|nr:tellurite-like stress resistance cysteine protease StiP [Thermodesulfobacteriota bacterium]